MTPTNRKPTVTLAQLRKLANRKGYEGPNLHHNRNGMSTLECGFFSVAVWYGSMAMPHQTQALRVMFAALSALPDVSKGKKGKK